METAKPSNWNINVYDRVHIVEFSPFNWCGSLIAIGSSKMITIGKCTFPDEETDVDSLEFTNLREFHHGIRILSIAWSPETNLDLIPRLVKFATSSADHKVRIYSSDLKNTDNVQLVEGHTSYINDIAFEPENGATIASVSDDNTCRVWDLDGNCLITFMLRSPGMTVCWHNSEAGKLLVGEKGGIIRFYNLITQQPIMSLDSARQPLLMADWCPRNSLRVGSAVGSDWVIWDTARSSRPIETHGAHMNLSQVFRWCPSNENIIATIGRPGNQIKVFTVNSAQICLMARLPVIGGLSWHYKLPVIAVGGDNQVHFWLVEGL